MKHCLMIPGPVEVMDGMLEAYNGQPVAHYDAELTRFYLDTAQNVEGR
jgi:aspartate aminotransferase-like enzyme